MKQRSVFVFLVLLLFLAGTVLSAQESGSISDRGYANPDALISAEELRSIMDEDDVKVIDFRNTSSFITGHIPGAIQIGLSELEDGSAKYPTMRAPAEQTAEVLASKGISPTDTIVVYDDNGLWGARIWWLLEMYGHEDVRLLDGGLNRWKELGYNTRIMGSRTRAGEYEFSSPGTDTLATLSDVQSAIDNETIILDSRSWAEYTGETVARGAGEGGRIPSSVWVEWTEAVNADGTFKSASELREIYSEAGISGDAPVIAYCQGGVRGAHSFFVLHALLGFSDVSNYDGSWIEWSNEPGLPISRGE
ncbi:MAG: sulfurtransferase [Spirochaetaceae bacterium]